MPNYCSNRLIIKGPTNKLIEFIQKYCSSGRFDLNVIIPEPQQQKDCDSDCIVDVNSHIEINNDRPWFDWHTWHCKYWDTKWNTFDLQCPDIEDVIEGECNEIELWFNTAWSPCTTPINKLIFNLEPDLDINYYYYEPGFAFGGGCEDKYWFDVGEDELRDFSIEYEFESPEYWDAYDAEQEALDNK